MSEFYTKTKNGKYIPVTFKEIITKNWENKLIAVRIGSDEYPADESEIEETLDSLNDADALEALENTSFLISLHSLDFEVVGSLKEIGEKYISVKVTGNDDLSKIGSLQKAAKEQLRGKTKKVVILPAPLTVKEYAETVEILERLKTRRARRSR